MTATMLLPPKQFATVKADRLGHVELGNGGPIVLLHANPTPSCFWRDVTPPLALNGPCLALAPETP